jgi:hypothetical protein
MGGKAMKSNIQILSDLRLTMEMKQDLELMGIYKGVPVISKAKITKIEGEVVTMISNDPSLVCLRDKNQISILGSDYFEPSTAKILKVDLKNGEVILHDFSYLGNRLGERMIVRVEPKTPLPFTLESGEIHIHGELVDISMNGAGFRIPLEQYNPALKPGTQVQIDFELPKGQISLSGTVLSGAKTGEQYRLSVRFNSYDAQKKNIFRYMIDRRGEIEQELRQEFDQALQDAG